MIEVSKVKESILSFLNENGPSLPLKIAKHIGLTPIFATAILAELSNEKRVKLSNLKIGSSSLYLLPHQDALLERFSDELRGPKKEAYLKLKENKILEDDKQTPLIKVALRSIKDFAILIKAGEKMFWRYVSVTNDEVKQILSKIPQNQQLTEREQKEEMREMLKENLRQREIGQRIWEDIAKEKQKEEIIQEIEEISREIEEIKEREEQVLMPQYQENVSVKKTLGEIKVSIGEPKTEKPREQEQAPVTKTKESAEEHKEKKHRERKQKQDAAQTTLSGAKEIKPLVTKSPAEKSDKIIEFLEKIKAFLASKKIDFLEEQELDKKAITLFARINSDIGPLKLLVIAKDKKRISEKDIQEAYKKAISEKMPCILLSYADISKKTRDFLQQYKDLIKLEKLN